ncbi:MAG: glycosyltransferase [Saprospiraceae bacterium]
MKKIIATVTNDLNQDQRMHRICGALADMGYDVLLVGRKKQDSQPLLSQVFDQKRINCFFSKGVFFYGEYNFRLILFLIFSSQRVVYSVDLDTLFAGGIVSRLKNIKLIHDAHEYFVEVPELAGNKFKKMLWDRIGKWFIPKADLNITVNRELAVVLEKKYGAQFEVIRNTPVIDDEEHINNFNNRIILYQGVLNKGRGLEELIAAMNNLPDDIVLHIAGEGDLSKKLRAIVKQNNIEKRVKFLGWLSPAQLKEATKKATIGLNLLSSDSLNYKYSLANKFFDYMHAEVPSINMDFPVYRRICSAYPVGLCIPDLHIDSISEAILSILESKETYNSFVLECKCAKYLFCWEKEAAELKRMVEGSFGLNSHLIE